MIHRVFSFADLPCHGRLQGPDGKEVRVPILRLARDKAVLRTEVAIEAARKSARPLRNQRRGALGPTRPAAGRR